MSIKELDRLKILQELHEKQIYQKQAADSLGLSTKQVRRLIKHIRLLRRQGLYPKNMVKGEIGNYRKE